jgi:hypothetical protein
MMNEVFGNAGQPMFLKFFIFLAKINFFMFWIVLMRLSQK